jgi:hypothetical protein
MMRRHGRTLGSPLIALIPLALKGVRYRPMGAGPLLRNFLLVCEKKLIAQLRDARAGRG